MPEFMKATEERVSYDKNLELIRRYRMGDKAAGEELAVINQPLVYNIAGRFSSRCNDIDELVEIGTIGLVKAINTFDFSKGCAFSTYAVPLIFGEIRRFLQELRQTPRQQSSREWHARGGRRQFCLLRYQF